MRVKRAIAGLPDTAHVTLPVEVLRSWLDEDGEIEPEDELVDWTVRNVADRLGRSPSTVRGWCGSGVLPGAYRFRGREWRIPRRALRALLDSEAEGRRRDRPGTIDTEQINIGAWQEVRS